MLKKCLAGGGGDKFKIQNLTYILLVTTTLTSWAKKSFTACLYWIVSETVDIGYVQKVYFSLARIDCLSTFFSHGPEERKNMEIGIWQMAPGKKKFATYKS
jgi:hypothetical protein